MTAPYRLGLLLRLLRRYQRERNWVRRHRLGAIILMISAGRAP